jgi:hypothetical protein
MHSFVIPKAFFGQVNEKWLQDLKNAVEDLVKCLPPEEQPIVIDEANKLKQSWQVSNIK